MAKTHLQYAKEIFDALFVNGDVIFDPVEGEPTPPDHYAYTFAALTSVLLYKRTNEIEYKERAKQLLRIYFDFPLEHIGHWEFNKYVLAEICLSRVFAGEEIEAEIVRFLEIPRWQSDVNSDTSYNWLGLRALYHYIAGIGGLPEGDKDKASEIFRNTVLKRQTEEGFFYDYSSGDKTNNIASPLTYHTKICFCLVRYWELSKDAEVVPAILSAINVLSETIFDSGDAFWFGRTNGGLFGYSAALYVFSVVISSGLLDVQDPASDGYAKLHRGMMRLRNEDGSFKLNHHPEQGKRPGWDGYMFFTVYNAYAAALFALSPDVDFAENEEGKSFDKKLEIGLHVISGKGDEGAFITSGQMVLGQGGFFADGRQIGMQPALIRDGQKAIIPPPPYNSKTIPLRLSPRNLGFVPVLRRDGVDYAVHIYNDIEYYDIAYGDIEYHHKLIVGTGQPVAIEYLPREERSRLYRYSDRVKSIVTGESYKNMQVSVLPDTTVRRAMLWLRDEMMFISATAVSGAEGNEYFGSGVRFAKDANCRYSVIEPQIGYDIEITERETSWGTAEIVYPRFNATVPLLIEVLSWGETTAEEIPNKVIDKIRQTVSLSLSN